MAAAARSRNQNAFYYMQLGSSVILDLALCAGLGVAAVSCAASAIEAVSVIASARMRECWKTALRVFVFLLAGGALLSVAAFIGSTKSFRHADSVLGFVVGVVATFALGLLVRKIRRAPGTQ